MKDCVHIIFEDEVKDWLQRAEQNVWPVYVMNGDVIFSERDLMEDMASAMKFPDYFGYNWNAVVDCLSLTWSMPHSGHVLLMHNAYVMLSRFPKLTMKLFAIWITVARESVRFFVQLHLVLVLPTYEGGDWPC